jgi:hypothetical protein
MFFKNRSWRASQTYELTNAELFMQGDFFKQLFAEIVSGQRLVSKGYRDPTLLQEFFGSDEGLWHSFLAHITAKRALEIGPAVASELATWDVVKDKYVIEPLYDQIAAYQQRTFGTTCFEGITCYSQPAEQVIPELLGNIDGAILCRNCLDHTPNWRAVLENIAQYASPGAYLLLWTDLYHPHRDEGHYNLMKDKEAFRKLIEKMGFEILLTYSQNAEHLDFGCLGRRLGP